MKIVSLAPEVRDGEAKIKKATTSSHSDAQGEAGEVLRIFPSQCGHRAGVNLAKRHTRRAWGSRGIVEKD